MDSDRGPSDGGRPMRANHSVGISSPIPRPPLANIPRLRQKAIARESSLPAFAKIHDTIIAKPFSNRDAARALVPRASPLLRDRGNIPRESLR